MANMYMLARFQPNDSLIQEKELRSNELDLPVQQMINTVLNYMNFLMKRVHNISNTSTPTFEEHCGFMSSHPYLIVITEQRWQLLAMCMSWIPIVSV